MKTRKSFTGSRFLSLVLISLIAFSAQADDLRISKGKVTLDFATSAENHTGPYTIQRSMGRFGQKEMLGQTSKPLYTDKAGEQAASMYYHITDAQGQPVAMLSFDQQLLGSGTYVFRPSDDMQQIHTSVEELHRQMFHEQFGKDRYAVLFMPGDYRQAGVMQVPYYMHLAGLGKTPYDVQISNVHTPAPLPNNNGTCTFWRSLENFSVIGPETYQEEETFLWAVSQAAPIRRVYSERTVKNQWLNGWVSGGFTADCYFIAPAGSDGQQQWYTRNTYLGKGRGRFKEGSWNFMFQGVQLGPEAKQDTYVDNWDKGGNITFVPTTPVIREKPFLFFDQE